jgi:hypothetical protein
MENQKKEAIVSIDVETDNGNGSEANGNMWEVAFTVHVDGEEVASYTSLIQCRPEIPAATETLEWIRKSRLEPTYLRCRNLDPTVPSPEVVMAEISQILVELQSKYIVKFIASPSSFDWAYFKNYFCRYAPEERKNILPHKCHCISAMVNITEIIRHLTTKEEKNHFWQNLTQVFKHTHVALDDAREQAYVYNNLLAFVDDILEKKPVSENNPPSTTTPTVLEGVCNVVKNNPVTTSLTLSVILAGGYKLFSGN